MKLTYLLINFFSVIIPFLFSFHPKIQFYKNWKAFILSAFIVGTIFIIWDIYFTSIGVWSFNTHYTTGITLFSLPIEEILFFVCIPYACVFTYHCLTKFYHMDWQPQTEKYFCLVFSIILLSVGLLHLDKLYTSFTFLSTAAICLLLNFYFRINWFGKALTVYTFLLVPFFIVNGILTGTGLAEPVVQYNNAENLSIRMLTIPVEDVFYGLELYLLNIFFFQLFSRKLSREHYKF